MKYLVAFMFLLLLCIPVVQAEMRVARGERKLSKAKRELNGNIFDIDALRHSLQTQNERVPYQDPFLGEPTLNHLDIEHDARNHAFRNRHKKSAKKSLSVTAKTAKSGKATKEPQAAADSVLHLATKGKGKSKRKSSYETIAASSSLSKSKGKGKSGKSSYYSYSSASGKSGKSSYYYHSSASGKSGKSRSRSSGKGKGKGKRKSVIAKGSYYFTKHPTIAPTVDPGTPSPMTMPPTSLAPRPTCPPGSGFFPEDVSDFFGMPSSSSGSLEDELNDALNQIQVPGGFADQCIR